MNKKILLGLTTTPGADWRQMIIDAKKLGITEVAFFPTFLKPDQRQEIYLLLENSPISSIPHIHLRDDFTLDEVDYLVDRYHPQALNLHSDKAGEEAIEKLSKYRNLIFIENQYMEDPERFESLLKKSAGLCVDFSHLEDHKNIRNQEGYKHFDDLLKNYHIGCCHISAIRSVHREENEHSYHTYSELSEFNYVKKYQNYLPDLISLELENSFPEQLQTKAYIERLIHQR